jgi:electron-transferring-flavoprotein dehydrogenase
MERVDVAVVGGGPAGSAAARAAASGGAETVVLEKGVPRADREEIGPDSTDAAGILDYWFDIMEEDPADFPEGVVLRELDSATFVGPSEEVVLESTGIETERYDGFGVTFERARFDDFLRAEAEAAGAEYRVGASVASVDSCGRERERGYEHTLHLRDGEQIACEFLVLADGPQRQVTMGVLDQFLPDNDASTLLSPPRANHIAYQEYRRLPEAVFDPSTITFWWGWMPGETAYPWIFPNDGNVARVGLTMPIGLDVEDFDPAEWRLLRADDERIPSGGTYVRRLLDELYGDEYDVERDFPLVEDRGKSGGTETYAISSTRPVDSPTAAGIAVVGGAMGATSAFHEGGDHVAVRTGKIAGRLAAEGDLRGYNEAWKAAIGEEVIRNVAMADVVADYGPEDWDDTFRIARGLKDGSGGGWLLNRRTAMSVSGGLSLYTKYKRAKFRYRNGKYVQLPASAYEY